MINNQKGFTLLELIIGMVFLSSFLSVLYVATSGVTDNISRQKNEVFPSELVNMIKDHYLFNTYEIDTSPQNTYVSGEANIPNGSLTTTNNIKESLTNMIDTVHYSNMTFRDGYNQPMMILVSELLEKNYEGVMIPYRVFSVVSTNNIDVMGPETFNTTMDVTTGEVDIDPNETVVTIDTFKEQLERFKSSKEKVERMSRAYSHYYWSRYNLESGDIAKDYFASGGTYWDNLGGQKVSKSCESGTPDNVNGYNTPGVDVSNVNFVNALGLSNDFENNEWGEPIYLMNCGTINNVLSGGETLTIEPRNPDASSSNKRIQPFNAVIGFTMPNGESYFQVISSRT